MYIQPNYQAKPNFGIKIPVKTAIEAATGRFLEDGKTAYPRQKELLSQLSDTPIDKLYSGEMADAMRNMSKVIRERHPDLKAASERINKECEIINQDRTFLPEDEIVVKERINKIWNQEAKKIGKEQIDIETMSLKDLGLDKYNRL